MSSATLGISKVYILDKYFTELQKFWDTEKRLQGRQINNILLLDHRIANPKNESGPLMTPKQGSIRVDGPMSPEYRKANHFRIFLVRGS